MNDNVIDLSLLGRVRGPWEPLDPPADRLAEMGPHELHQLRVHDGYVIALVFERPTGYQVVLNQVPSGKRQPRALTWYEVQHAREHLLPPDMMVVATVPPASAEELAVALFEYPPRPVGPAA